MADAYGGISMATSKYCVVNAAALVKALNNLQWTDSGGEWITRKDRKKDDFWHTDSYAQYPTARPERTIAVIVEQEDGELLQIPAEIATQDDWDNMYDSESSPVELKIFSEMFSPHIVKGWIEIACCANEKNRYVYFESLRIHANGTVESKSVVSGICSTPANIEESFKPAA